jgi:NADH pyrophosphatase NudC (nudix superfamily)
MSKDYRHCPRCATALEDREIEGISRRACPDEECGFVHFDNPTPVVAVLVQRGEQVILARNKAWPPKMFSLITGFVERGEDPAATACRETKEELGLDARDPELIGVYPFAQLNQVLIAYHVRAEGEIVLGDELAEVRRIEPAKLKPWPFGPGLAVRDWLEGKG